MQGNRWDLKWKGNRQMESEFVRNLVFGWQMMMRELKDFVRNAFDICSSAWN
jgi:hypothetical protein